MERFPRLSSNLLAVYLLHHARKEILVVVQTRLIRKADRVTIPVSSVSFFLHNIFE